MSTSILYLAIVAIWACFLVPAWLRRPHAESADAEFDDDASDWAERVTDTESDVEMVVGADADAEVTRRGAENAPYRQGEPGRARSGRADSQFAAAPVFVDEPPPTWVDLADAEPGTGGHAGAESGSVPTEYSQTSQSRQQMMRARRRMLTILVMLTAITGAFTALGEVRWWICVPPAGMLVLYVLLLREIAQADAELARKRDAWLARADRQAADARRQRAHDAWAPRAAQASGTDRLDGAESVSWPVEQTAKIIDFSRRVGDQLYDQYADAAVRAVGD